LFPPLTSIVRRHSMFGIAVDSKVTSLVTRIRRFYLAS
jgi:hypothetical protein